MTHETHREMLALRLYGELDVEDAVRLDAHLEECADCRAFAAELDAGLGALAGEVPVSVDGWLPADWDDRLETAVRATIPPRAWWPRVGPWVGFAAGILFMWLLQGVEPVKGTMPDDPRAEQPAQAAPPTFERATPPPRARSSGTLARLARHRHR